MLVEHISLMPSSCLSLQYTPGYLPSNYSLRLSQSGICGRLRQQKWTKGGSYSRRPLPSLPIPLAFSLSPYPLPVSTPTTLATWRTACSLNNILWKKKTSNNNRFSFFSFTDIFDALYHLFFWQYSFSFLEFIPWPVGSAWKLFSGLPFWPLSINDFVIAWNRLCLQLHQNRLFQRWQTEPSTSTYPRFYRSRC